MGDPPRFLLDLPLAALSGWWAARRVLRSLGLLAVPHAGRAAGVRYPGRSAAPTAVWGLPPSGSARWRWSTIRQIGRLDGLRRGLADRNHPAGGWLQVGLPRQRLRRLHSFPVRSESLLSRPDLAAPDPRCGAEGLGPRSGPRGAEPQAAKRNAILRANMAST